MKKLIAVLLTGDLLLSAVGCSDDTGESGGGNTAVSGSVAETPAEVVEKYLNAYFEGDFETYARYSATDVLKIWEVWLLSFAGGALAEGLQQEFGTTDIETLFLAVQEMRQDELADESDTNNRVDFTVLTTTAMSETEKEEQVSLLHENLQNFLGDAINATEVVRFSDITEMCRVRAVLSFSSGDSIETVTEDFICVKINNRWLVFEDGSLLSTTMSTAESMWANSNRREMPDLRSMDYEEVVLTYDWLQLNTTHEYSSSVPVGHIMSQSVRPQQMVNPNQTIVEVVVSRGQRLVRMPDFSGRLQTESEVVDELERLGLVPTIVRVQSDEVPVGYFIRSDRQADEVLALGDTVRIWVSLGRNESANVTTIPNFMGMEQSEAEQLARDSRLTVTFDFAESSEEQRGRVLNQSSPHSIEVPNNYVIALTIGTGIP